MTVRAAIPAVLAIALAGCRTDPESSPGAAPPVTAARAAHDEPLPAPDEVPEFLRGARAAAPAPVSPGGLAAPLPGAAAPHPAATGPAASLPGAAEPATWPDPAAQPSALEADSLPGAPEPTLAELLRQVRPGDEGDGTEGDSFAYVAPAADEARPEEGDPGDPSAPAAQDAVAHVGDEELPGPAEPADQDGADPDDPCAPLRDAIETRKGYLGRTAAERDRFGYVEDGADAAALRLLESLRRCEAHPEDPDCSAPAVERDVDELTAAPHTVERDPSELDVSGRDEVVHDPELLELINGLEACERRRIAQPLLTR